MEKEDSIIVYFETESGQGIVAIHDFNSEVKLVDAVKTLKEFIKYIHLDYEPYFVKIPNGIGVMLKKSPQPHFLYDEAGEFFSSIEKRAEVIKSRDVNLFAHR